MNKEEKVKKPKGGGKSITLFEHLSIQQKIDFSRHLSMVVKAGLPLFQGLSIIREQAEKGTLRRIIDRLMKDVDGGRFLADGLERYKHVFGEFFINLVRVGEASGTLAQNLAYLSDELKKAKALRSRVRSAMIYPVIVLVATLVVVAFLAFFVFPKLLTVFEGLNVTLPTSTRILISTVGFLRADGLYLLGGLILAYIILRLMIRFVRPVRYVLHRMLFMVPVLSGLTVSINVTNFARILALLLKSGVNIVEGLDITAKTFDNLVYRKHVLAAKEEVKGGGQLADALGRHKTFFPILATGMVRVGESTGNLEENLEYLTEYYTEEVDNKLQNLTSLLEPLLLLVMGGMVAFVALSIILPIYQSTSAVQ